MKKKFRTVVLAIACASLLTACGSESKTSADAPTPPVDIGVISNGPVKTFAVDSEMWVDTLTFTDKNGKEKTVEFNATVKGFESKEDARITEFKQRPWNEEEKEKLVKYFLGEGVVYSYDMKDRTPDELQDAINEEEKYLKVYRSEKNDPAYEAWSDEYYDSLIEGCEERLKEYRAAFQNASETRPVITEYNHNSFVAFDEAGYKKTLEFYEEELNPYGPQDFYNDSRECMKYTSEGDYSDSNAAASYMKQKVKDILVDLDLVADNSEDVMDFYLTNYTGGEFAFPVPMYSEPDITDGSKISVWYCGDNPYQFAIHRHYELMGTKDGFNKLISLDEVKKAIVDELKSNANQYRFGNFGAIDCKSLKATRFLVQGDEPTTFFVVPAWRAFFNDFSIIVSALDGSILKYPTYEP